ncbi:hypothetical protein QNH46_06060 [Paenibacillus woosongensis]|uniref:Uncharacterized protein n=1 Tax=Paenibacillus woosongensis TaxID=307580 RepID=A0AA95I6D4_9BACL|nr:hypothetical protein [Paenibacillus woosongensis]WHX50226.1 hypothetical protein QNH46_06060 [Paenibacillus woosongensis]
MRFTLSGKHTLAYDIAVVTVGSIVRRPKPDQGGDRSNGAGGRCGNTSAMAGEYAPGCRGD